MGNITLDKFDKRINNIKVCVVAVPIDDIDEFNNMSYEEQLAYGQRRYVDEGYGMWSTLRSFENALNDDMVDTTNEYIKFVPLE